MFQYWNDISGWDQQLAAKLYLHTRCFLLSVVTEVWHVSCWSSTTVMPPCHPIILTGDCTPLSSPELGGSEAVRPLSRQRLPCLTPRRLETGRGDRRGEVSGAEEDGRREELSRRNVGYWFLVRNICWLGVTWLSLCLISIISHGFMKKFSCNSLSVSTKPKAILWIQISSLLPWEHRLARARTSFLVCEISRISLERGFYENFSILRIVWPHLPLLYCGFTGSTLSSVQHNSLKNLSACACLSNLNLYIRLLLWVDIQHWCDYLFYNLAEQIYWERKDLTTSANTRQDPSSEE